MTPVLWIAVVLMLGGAALLVAGVGSSGVWIAVLAVGIAIVAIDRISARRSLGS